MANDTTVEAVVKILDPDSVDGMQEAIDNEELNIDFALETAKMQVDDLCADSEYSDARMELIKRWLSAHFVCIPLPKTKQEAAKGLTETYEGQTKLGLDFTRYGQQAKFLDYKGNLAAVDQIEPGKGKVTARISYIGGCGDPRKA